MNKEYIEREECLTELNHIINEYIADNSVQCNIAAGTAIDIRDNVIVKLPAADVKPVVRGRWYDEGSFDAHYQPIYRCSVCNKTVADNYISEHKYCLHCGVEMNRGKSNA